jgi:hypothetical protein
MDITKLCMATQPGSDYFSYPKCSLPKGHDGDKHIAYNNHIAANGVLVEWKVEHAPAAPSQTRQPPECSCGSHKLAPMYHRPECPAFTPPIGSTETEVYPDWGHPPDKPICICEPHDANGVGGSWDRECPVHGDRAETRQPVEGSTNESCLLCGLIKGKAIIHEPSGVYVCMACRDKVQLVTASHRECDEVIASIAAQNPAGLANEFINAFKQGWRQALRGAPSQTRQPPTEELKMTNKQITYMVERFLGWKLPQNFNPDGGISFTPTGNTGTPHEYKHNPVGTNLFDATQAEEMVHYMLEGMPQ